MRILVLGGTGWLGTEFARQAVQRGHDVTCLARGQAGPAAAGAKLIRADRSVPDAYREAAGPDDGPRGGGTHWDAVLDTAREPGHVRGAVRALWNARQYVFVSSVSVYAERFGHRDETARLLPPLAADVMAGPQEYGNAKAADERAVQQAFDDRAAIIRPGLIGGPGDDSGRSGYWPMRLAHPAADDGRVLVPDTPRLPTQLIDVRDLAAWLVQVVEERITGTFNAVGEAVPLAEHLELAARAGGGPGRPAPADEQWLTEQGVRAWAGPRSLPLWPGPDREQRSAVSWQGRRARDAGLRIRELEQTLADTLAWEQAQGIDRPRQAGLSREEERELLRALDAVRLRPGQRSSAGERDVDGSAFRGFGRH